MTKDRIVDTEQAWDDRELGADEQYVRVSKQIDSDALDEAAGLHPISIRLQRSLIDDLKKIAKINGIGYQPLVRQVLKRFVDAEMKKLLQEKLHEIDEEQESGLSIDVDLDGKPSDQNNNETACG